MKDAKGHGSDPRGGNANRATTALDTRMCVACFVALYITQALAGAAIGTFVVWHAWLTGVWVP